jgi:ABC-2 type transport system ATP-binding protein
LEGKILEKIIEVNKLEKYYSKLKALDELSFDVYKGEILGLLGPNGSGKSTTINCLLSLLNFDKGNIKIFGKEMTPDAYDIKSKIGVVFQDVAVFDELTVYENINYFCGLYIKDKETRKKYVEEAIELVGLNEFRKFFPKKLSGGLLRRLNIACGIAHKPELIFLDEPTVAVDPQSRNNILEGIKKLNERGATIVYTTHYMEEVEHLCNRIIIIDKGRIIAQGTNEELKEIVTIGEKVTIELEGLAEETLKEIKEFDNIYEANYDGKVLYITYRKGKYNLSNLVEYLKNKKIKYTKIFSEMPSLNDVFLELTGKELRD